MQRTAKDLALKLTDYDLPSLLNGFSLISISAVGLLVEFLSHFVLTPRLPTRNSGIRRILLTFAAAFAASLVFFYFSGRYLSGKFGQMQYLVILSVVASASVTAIFSSTPTLSYSAFTPLLIPAPFVLLHIFSLGSSSFVEEEHQIAYFFYATLVLVCAATLLRRSENLEKRFHALFWASVVLGSFAIARKWNQTGNKWLGTPDIALFVSTSHPALLSLLILSSLVVFILLSCNWLPAQPARRFGLTTIALFAFVCAIKLDLISASFLSRNTAARLVYLGVFCLLSGVCLGKSPERSSPWRSVLLIVTALEVVLAKPINIPVILLILLQAVGLVQLASLAKLDSFQLTTLMFFAGRASWFALGSSNSLSTIDLAGAYLGLENYNPVAVGILLLLSMFAGPIIIFIAQMAILSEAGEPKRFQITFSAMSLTRALTLAVFCVVITVVRYHLFIWSVFSPKFFYECFHTALHLLFSIVLLLTSENYPPPKIE